MTPRHADIAFELEAADGVVALYAIDPGKPRVADHLDFAVRLAPGGHALAVAHYAMLRVITHAECTRVYFFVDSLPAVVAEAAQQLVLSAAEREQARERAGQRAHERAHERALTRPQGARELEPSVAASREPRVLIVDDDPAVEKVVAAVVPKPAQWTVAKTVAVAKALAGQQEPDLVLCAARLAFGLEGLLASLPLPVARKVLVLAWPSELVEARWRLQGRERILVKPLEDWLVQNRVARSWTTSDLAAPDREHVAGPMVREDRLQTPDPSAPFSALVVDLDETIHEQLRWCCRGEARHVMRRDHEDAAATALSTPFHVIAISANAALSPRSFLDAVARSDRAGADRVLVFAPARDVPYVKYKLAAMARKNLVLAMPIDDTTLRREILRAHPALAARLAVEEALEGNADPTKRLSPRFGRPAVLIVDDDLTTAIFFAASGAREDADITLVATPMEAFAHIVERPVDLLIVSATMRSDGGEPFYRVLWRLKPELKSRCVLATAAALAPPSAPAQLSAPRRVVERPLTPDAIGRIVQAFARR